MPVVAVCALVGVVAGLWVPAPGGITGLSLAGVVFLPLFWWLGGMPGSVLLLAYMAAALQSLMYVADLPAHDTVPQDAVVQGCLTDFPVEDVEGYRFTVRLHSAGTDQWPARIALRTYGTGLQIAAHACWQLRVRIKPAHGLSNPGSVDRAVRLFADGIGAVGYVRDSPLNRPLDSKKGPAWLRLRRALYDQIADVLPDMTASRLVPGIVLGARQDLLPEQWQVLRATGTTHLMAISGLHIGLVAWLLWHLARIATLRWAGAGFMASELIAAVTAAAGALGYAGMAGFAAPTVRATGMLLLVLLLRARSRPMCGNTILATVFVLAVLGQPTVVLTGGFWLSYIAVLALINSGISRSGTGATHTTPWLERQLQRLATAITVQWRLSLVLMVPVLWLFGQVAVLAPLANLLAIPFFACVILPLLLSGAVLLVISDSGALLYAGSYGLQIMLAGLGWLAGQPWALWEPSGSVWASGWIALAGVMLLLRPLPARQTMAGGLCLILGVLLQFRPPPADLAVHVLDVGQGTAVIVQSGKRALLFDTGPRWRSSDAGQRTVVPALHALGVRRLDLVVISHGDSDHAGGLPSVLAALPFGRLIAPEQSAASGYPVLQCRRGQRWHWQGVLVSVLHPATVAGWSRNNASCVMLLEWSGGGILLPGDIEAHAEAVLAAREPLTPVDLLVVPHHGSRTSSTLVLLDTFPARAAVFTSAYGNRWGFPHSVITQRWMARSPCVLNTALHGAASFNSANGNLRLRASYKSHWLRPWAIRAPVVPGCERP